MSDVDLVKTGQQPKSFPYVMLKKGSDDASASEERIALLMKHSGSVNMLVMKYALYMSEEIIRAETSVFHGPDFPYMTAWVSNGADDMSRSNRQRAIMNGYRPVDIREDRFQDYLVVGEKAAMLGIDRSTPMLLNYRRVKTPPPEALPAELKDKWGFVLPPVVQQDGSILVNGRKLYFTEKKAIEERKEIKRKNSSRVIVRDQPGFLADENNGYGQMEEVSIDM